MKLLECRVRQNTAKLFCNTPKKNLGKYLSIKFKDVGSRSVIYIVLCVYEFTYTVMI
jgi:hypothetical protein